PASHLAHGERLEKRPPKPETQHVLEYEILPKRQRQPRPHGSSDHDADPIAGNAVHSRPEHLTPPCRYVLLVGSPKRFAAAEDVKERADGPGERSENHESPLEDRRLRSGPPDVYNDEEERRNREDPPQKHRPVEHAERLSNELLLHRDSNQGSKFDRLTTL